MLASKVNALWLRLHDNLAVLVAVIVHPRQTFDRITALWHDLVNGAMVVDTPDPRGRWPVVLRTSIQLDGDTLTIVDKRWLATGSAAELQASVQEHSMQVIAQLDPFEELRRVQTATWYLVSCVASAFAVLAVVMRHNPVQVGIYVFLTVAPLLLRWFAPRLLRRMMRVRWSWLEQEYHALAESDVRHLLARRAARIGRHYHRPR